MFNTAKFHMYMFKSGTCNPIGHRWLLSVIYLLRLFLRYKRSRFIFRLNITQFHMPGAFMQYWVNLLLNAIRSPVIVSSITPSRNHRNLNFFTLCTLKGNLQNHVVVYISSSFKYWLIVQLISFAIMPNLFFCY